MAKRATLTYDKNWYTPINIRQQIRAGNEAQIRKEYTRLRDISQKRLKRLAAAGYSEDQIYKQNVNKFKELKDIKSQGELAQRLSDLSRFISYKGSTVAGQKAIMKKSLSTLHEHGYDFVNPGNYKEFGKFMEEYHNQLLDMEYDSGDPAEVFRVAQLKKVPLDDIKADFHKWLEKQDKAEQMADLYFTLKRFNIRLQDIKEDEVDKYLDNLWALKRVRADRKSINNLGIVTQRMQKIVKRNK